MHIISIIGAVTMALVGLVPILAEAVTVSIHAPSPAVGKVDVTASTDSTNRLRRLEIRIDGTLVATCTTTPCVYPWDTATVPNGSHTLRARRVAKNGSTLNSAPLTVQVENTAPPPPPADTVGIWPDTATPANPSELDPNAVELGVKFRSDVPGDVLGIRFYKGPQNTGTHTGTLWDTSGQQLASLTFTNETSSGWQQALFATPVRIEAQTTYVASYHAPRGHYAGDNNGLASEVYRAPLRALASAASGGNGVYTYGASGFPTDTWQASNYWVDVVFRPDSGESPPPPPPPPETGIYPVLPQVTVDTTMPTVTGNTYTVNTGGNLQAALNSAAQADPNLTHLVSVQAGATFTGTFTLPSRGTGTGWVLIQSSAVANLPPEGTRVGPNHAHLMPKIVTSGTAITAGSGAHRYRLVGVEIVPSTFVFNLVSLNGSHLVFDRSYLHGHAFQGTRRGIAMNGAHQAVIDSYLSDFKEVGADSQAVCGWSGAGPFKLVNNYLEGAGENVMFGGADPGVTNLVPSDIEVRGNHVFKPLTWMQGHPSYAGTPWTVKNLFELKNARRVLVEHNVFEHNWLHGQNGFAILFTVRNQDGGCPWCAVQDVTFRHNRLRDSASGFNMHGEDNLHPSERTRRILIAHNLFEDIDGPTWGGGHGWLFMVLNGVEDLTIEHNTGFPTAAILFAAYGPSPGLIFRNNLMAHGSLGVIGDGTGDGTHTLSTYFPGYEWTHNVLIGGGGTYPPETYRAPTMNDVGFVNWPAGDYPLAPSSPYHEAATDGADIGANIDALIE